jgi:hypothetical protein
VSTLSLNPSNRGTAHDTDATATFTDIALRGDFYTAVRGGSTGAGIAGKNMVLTFDGSSITGVISASRSKQAISTITSADYLQLGQVTNTVSPIVNNGVIVNLNHGSSWKVTGTSYLSRLVVGADAAVTAPAGQTLSMTVDGVATAITPGSAYTGAIVLTVS